MDLKVLRNLVSYCLNTVVLFNIHIIVDILITTPNRICFLLKQEPPAISLAK